MSILPLLYQNILKIKKTNINITFQIKIYITYLYTYIGVARCFFYLNALIYLPKLYTFSLYHVKGFLFKIIISKEKLIVNGIFITNVYK